MKQTNIFKCSVLAAAMACLAGVPAMAQSEPLEPFSFESPVKQNKIRAEVDEDGAWTLTTTGGDPYISTTGLSRDLTKEEVCLTFEFKTNEECNIEFFVSNGPNVFEGGRSFMLTNAKPSAQWQRAYVDMEAYIAKWGWGKAGDNFRVDPGADAGIEFCIRDLKMVERPDFAAQFEKDEKGAIQINSQADFDAWIEANHGFGADETIGRMNVDLNCDVEATGTKGCIVEYLNGTLDGKGHTLTVDIHSEETDGQGVAFIRYCYGTVKNLNVTGTVEGKIKFLAGLAQDLFLGTLVENVYCDVNIISHINGDGTHGGIAARCQGSATLRNIVYAGKMFNPEGGTNSCGGITGWNNAKSNYEGVFMIGDISEIEETGCCIIGRNPGNVICNGVYATSTKGDTPANCIIVTEADLTDGAVCFGLNRDQKNIGFYQTIGTDPMPVLGNADGTHKQVFAVGDIRCDGKLPEDATFTNDGGSPIPDHQYENGKCVVCGHAQEGFLEAVDGWYEIRTADQLSFISSFATGNTDIKIKIMNDIDMTGVAYYPILGPFAGTIDGQGHTISNLVVIDPEADMVALVGMAGTATIKNLTLDETCYFEGKGYCAGFVGESSGGTLTLEGLFMHGNVKGSAANIAAIYACNMGSAATIKMTNCGMSGHISGGKESGLISGWFDTLGTLNGVWAVGTVEGSDNDTDAVFCRPASGESLTNCWSIAGSRSDVGKLSDDAADSGELTWKLNGETFLNPTWFQTLGEDKYPSLDNSKGIVYPSGDGYASFVPNDPDGFEKFKKGFFEVAEAFFQSEDVTELANKALVAEYEEIFNCYNEASTMDEFVEIYKAETAKKGEINNSINAYRKYRDEVAIIIETLETRTDFAGEDRDFLEEYVYDEFDADADGRAPNGSYEYIMENRTLTVAQINKEIENARELLRIAVAGGYEPGTDITNILVNANFSNDRNGWSGQLFTAAFQDLRDGFDNGSAEIWANTGKNMYQDITVSKAGVYELQVYGGYRPFDKQNEIQYYPFIYLNDNANYLQCVIEDYMPVEDAVNNVNVNLNPDQTPDRPITNEDGDTIGWALHGVQSVNIATSVGRYDNRILVNLEAGDKLRVGCNHPYSGFGSNEWVGIGNIHLTYVGELEEAGEALDRVLASQMARATVLQGIETTSGADYLMYPNYSQALKDRLAAAMEMAGASDNEGKYAAIVELGQVFKAIADCKRAYQDFFTQLENAYSSAFSAYELDPTCESMAVVAEQVNEQGLAAYEDGTMTAEEARACDIIKSLPIFPEVDENGTYHIANTAQYAYFVNKANTGTTDSNGAEYNVVLESDVYMNNSLIITNYYGTFDGQGHTLNVNIERTSDNAAPIEFLRGGNIKNLVVRGTINTANKYAAGIAAHAYTGNGRDTQLDRIQSYVDIIATISGDGTHAGMIAVNETGATKITNSVFAGSMSGSSCDSNGGIVGWSSAKSYVNGCMVIANITTSEASANIISRNSVEATNCVFITPYGTTPGGATQVDEAQMASGEAAYILNGKNTRPNVVWRQNLGDDVLPTLDPTHKIVYLKEDGTFTNEPQYELQLHNGDAADPYIINTDKEMAILRGFLQPGRVNYVKLGADIDMKDITDWYPLNMLEDNANGRDYQNLIDFDGQGHVIRNFSCTNEDKSYNSFFGILCGDVRNVGFENVNVVCTISGTGVLGGYVGHDQYVNEDYSRASSSLTNVWVTGKLTTGTAYTGGLVGHVGGPTTMTNCYTNLEIVSAGTTNNVGGIAGRVRERLVLENVYAAGSIDCASPNVGGIIGGGQLDGTNPGKYNNVVVWNNETGVMGATKPGMNITLPEADLFDLAIDDDGSVYDKSPSGLEVTVLGELNTGHSDKFNCNTYISKASSHDNPIGCLGIDYTNNEVLKDAFRAGYTIECTFSIDAPWTAEIKPFCMTESGGLGLSVQTDAVFHHMIHVGGDYAHATAAKAQVGQIYHMVGVYYPNSKILLYINGANKAENSANGDLKFPDNEAAHWIGIGADPSGTKFVGQSANNFTIYNARIYSQPMDDAQVYQLYHNLMGTGIDFNAGDVVNNISYYNGSNFAELQGVVVGWGKPWTCDMKEGSYPVFDGSQTGINGIQFNPAGRIFNLNGVEVEKAQKGIYIIDGQKVQVK